VSPVRYELGFYIPEDDNLDSHRRENLKSYTMCSYSHILRPVGTVVRRFLQVLFAKCLLTSGAASVASYS
jgi:hypothetical protein